MIGREDPGINRDFIFSRCLIQPTSISSGIAVRGKTDLAVIATLDNVRRNPDWGEPGDQGTFLAAGLTQPSGRIVILQFFQLFEADLALEGHDISSAGKQQNRG